MNNQDFWPTDVPLKRATGGGCGPGLRLLGSQNFEEEGLVPYLDTLMTHQGGLADLKRYRGRRRPLEKGVKIMFLRFFIIL